MPRIAIAVALSGLTACAVGPRRGPAGSVPALAMRADQSGRGEPLVLVGGGLTGALSWKPHGKRLSAGNRVVSLQLISVEYGLLDRPLPPGYSIKTESRAMAAALDAAGLTGPLDLVAWSFGALVTLDFALDNPGRVRTLTLIEPPAVWVLPDGGRGDPSVRDLEAAFRRFRGEISEADLEGFLCAVGMCPPGKPPRALPQWPVWVRHRRSLRNGPAVFDHRDDPARLRAFTAPVLLVAGTGTAPFLRRIVDSLGAALPRARIVEMPAGHAPRIVSMERFLTELASFLGSVK